MTIEVDAYLSIYDEILGSAQKVGAGRESHWNGRIVAWEDAMVCSRDIQEMALNILECWQDVDDCSFDRFADGLISAGTLPQEKTNANFFEDLLNKAAEESAGLHWSEPLPQKERTLIWKHPCSESFFQEHLPIKSMPTLLQKIEEIKRDRDAQFPPFKPQPADLIGDPGQGIVHFHCGISNSLETTQEGGLRLYESFDKKLAIQPHWIHKNNILHGASMVGLQQFEKACAEYRETPFVSPIAVTFEKIAHTLLSYSEIQKSIDYETVLISNMAKDILAQKNPKLKQVHVVFSNGGYVIKKTLESLPQEYKDTIIVIPVGPTAIIDNSIGCCEVYHVFGDKDWPSKMCNGGEKGICKAQENANIEIIRQVETETVVGGHYFLQSEYQDKIKEILNNKIIGEYEIYSGPE